MSGRNKKILLLVFVILTVITLRSSPLGSALTFENLQRNRQALLSFVSAHYVLSVVSFISVYVIVAALSIPGAVILTLAGGFLFGTAAGVLYVDAGATAGAVCAFLSARYLLGDRLQQKYGGQFAKFNGEMVRNGVNYLLTLRLIAVFPFFLINFLAGLTKVPLKTFLWTTAVGIIPGTAVFAYAGQQLGSINSPADILSKKVIAALAALGFITLAPTVWKRIRKAKTQYP
ncbi:MAG TPA: TVP38/TMEM64 family protein [Nitrospirota bacterium]|nr:TVP38/TMEM64 family protein [Nitrospirota bacterium]